MSQLRLVPCVTMAVSFAAALASGATSAACPFNVSEFSRALATVDGALFVRYPMFTVAETASGAYVGALASALDGNAIATTIATHERALDVNGNHRFDLDDALLITRYLAGFRGEALQPSAEDAMRNTAARVENYIANGCVAPVPTSCDIANGRVLTVGAGKTYATPRAAASAAQNGDVIKIDAGEYVGDYATFSANNLTICGEGGRAVIRMNPSLPINNRKALWVVSGNDIVIDGIEFRGATVPDQNGAGIRTEGVNLTVRDSGFFDNENGILGGLSLASTITIERSEFVRNGFGDGFSHNLYINNVGKLIVRASMFREAKVGHQLKSRARENVIEHSYFMDGATGNASYLVDFSNGGDVFFRGNLLHKGPNAENTSGAIAYGLEGFSYVNNQLRLIHNTMAMQRTSGGFGGYIVSRAGAHAIEMKANLLASTGSPALVTGGYVASNVIQANNVSATFSNLIDAGNVNAPNFFANAALLPSLTLAASIDLAYTIDAPQPLRMRSVRGNARILGALQNAP